MELTKYGLSLGVGVSLLMLFGKKGSTRDKWLLAGGFSFGVTAMELVVEYIWNKPIWEMIQSVLKGMAFFSIIVICGYFWEWIHLDKKQRKDVPIVHPIQEWMQAYQESFSQLSRSFAMVPQTVEGVGRNDRIWQNRLSESRIAAAGQLQEMSDILVGAMERVYSTKEDRCLEQDVGSCLRTMGIQVQKVFFYGTKGKHPQLYVTMRSKRKSCISVKKISDVLSELLDCEMMPARDSRSFLNQEWTTILFVEGTAYQVLYGVKKSKKENEVISGDNFSVFWLPEGNFYAGLSDGMGSGLQACSQSELVLDLLEQFLEAGFSKENAIRMINSSIVLQADAPVFSTMDLASIDLYTGICDFIKIGASSSFVRKGKTVEKIEGVGLPVGVGNELELEPSRFRLYDGNLLFMVTDGILSALPTGQEEEILGELIAQLPLSNPTDMAEQLLERVKDYGEVNDDMTVLVVGIWKR